jgi:hypothetical protein
LTVWKITGKTVGIVQEMLITNAPDGTENGILWDSSDLHCSHLKVI